MNGKVRTNEQGLHPLDRMDESEVTDLLTRLMTRMSPEEEYGLRHEDYVMEMPQSGERIRGRENMRAMQEAYPGPPVMRLRRVIIRDGLWIIEGVSDYGGQVFHTAAMIELRDGKMWRDTRYYAEPFEAPGWRAQWVERMESGEPEPAWSKPIVERRNELDEREMKRLVDRQWEKVRADDFAGAHEIYADDCVVEWPQSGERIRGKENLLALREAYPARVEFELRKVIVRRDLCVSEYVIRYDGKPVNVVSIMEFEGTKIVRETHYFADPFPPPEWRAQWVERMEAGREGRLMDIQIRPATEADEAAIKSMVRATRLIPTNLHWSRFLIAKEGERVVGMRQVKVHKGGTREVASGMVLPEYRRRGISARLMHALLDHEQGPLYLRCKEKWARYYERFGFRRVGPSELPADFRKDYRIGKIIVAILFLFSRRKPRYIPMKRDVYRARPARDDVRTLRHPVHVPPLGPKTGTTRSRKDGDQIALD